MTGGDFDGALAIKDVGVAKLTQTLFLINPTAFVPIDEKGLLALRKKLYGVQDWETYVREFGAVRQLFPGCETYEIQHFAYSVAGAKEKLDVANGEVWQSLATSDGTTREQAWDEFRGNGWIRHESDKLHDLREVAPGDLVFVHDGHASGYGIGVVHRNDYTEGWTANRRLHVLWLHTEPSLLSDITRGTRFSRGAAVMQKFRDAPAYKPTFELLKALGWGGEASAPDPDPPLSPQDPPPRPDLHTLAEDVHIDENELRKMAELIEDKKQVIFQGPPGTGKTYVAQKLAACLAGSFRPRATSAIPPVVFLRGLRPRLPADAHEEARRALRAAGRSAGGNGGGGPDGGRGTTRKRSTSSSLTRSTAATSPRSSASSISCWSTGTRGSSFSTRTQARSSPCRRISTSSAR